MKITTMPEPLLKKLGARVRDLRKERGFSQEVVAQKTGLHRTYIGSVERGQKNISLKNLYRLAQALEVKLQDLVEDID